MINPDQMLKLSVKLASAVIKTLKKEFVDKEKLKNGKSTGDSKDNSKNSSDNNNER